MQRLLLADFFSRVGWLTATRARGSQFDQPPTIGVRSFRGIFTVVPDDEGDTCRSVTARHAVVLGEATMCVRFNEVYKYEEKRKGRAVPGVWAEGLVPGWPAHGPVVIHTTGHSRTVTPPPS